MGVTYFGNMLNLWSNMIKHEIATIIDSVQWFRVLAKILKWGVQTAIFHENGVSNSYPFSQYIPNLRVSKIRIGVQKTGGQVSS